MTLRELADKDLRCATCGDGFVFSAGEQELYRLRGLTRQPEHCPNCARRWAAAQFRTPQDSSA